MADNKNDKYYKKKIDVSGHKRYDPRSKKKVDVDPYKRDQKFRQYQNIPMKQAREFFEKRSPLQKKIDLGIEAKRMFAVPNQLWLSIPNIVDIWGIDGYEPPIVDFLPKNSLPYEIVKFKDEIWVANELGKFTTPEKVITDIERFQKPAKPTKKRDVFEDYDTEAKRKDYEKISKKNAIWKEKTTNQYKKWLKEEYAFEEIAKKLSLKTSPLKLGELKEFYTNLKISDKNLKRVMFKVYNNKYKDEISSYTKDFQDFYDRRYYDLLEGKINEEANRLKKLNADPKRKKTATEKYYTQAMYNFRFPKIKNMLTSQDYGVISDFDVSDTLKAYPKWKDQDIVADLIEKYNARELIDSDIPDEYEDAIREGKGWDEQYMRYSKTEADFNEKYLIQQKLERELEKKDPQAYAKFRKEEIEKFQRSLAHVDYAYQRY